MGHGCCAEQLEQARRRVTVMDRVGAKDVKGKTGDTGLAQPVEEEGNRRSLWSLQLPGGRKQRKCS